MSRPLRILIVEGNTQPARAAHKKVYGETSAESYASVVHAIDSELVADIALPADEGANLPDPAGLEAYDGVFVTGSSLNIYDLQPAVTRQIDLMRAVYQSKSPVFGSCWGIQLGAVAAGGVVHRNPKGREVGFARRLTRTAAGVNHPLLEGRPAVWDAPAIHLDEVSRLPPDATPLAFNAVSEVQAAEFTHEGSVFWGVQYHPEFSMRELASIMRRRSRGLTTEGFASREDELLGFCDDLDVLHDDPTRQDLAWRYGLDEQTLNADLRTAELRNFIAHRVKPIASARGRA
ncbi:MAG: glutamine amidotransferase [Rhizobiales bacterium 65-9]|nr:type 1 glutamine amidotransferase [Hyphomicrobiales bacterium]OJY32930.1 MAG: glutamine amidotransferase [Rhizobiales bacterium 65-9]